MHQESRCHSSNPNSEVWERWNPFAKRKSTTSLEAANGVCQHKQLLCQRFEHSQKNDRILRIKTSHKVCQQSLGGHTKSCIMKQATLCVIRKASKSSRKSRLSWQSWLSTRQRLHWLRTAVCTVCAWIGGWSDDLFSTVLWCLCLRWLHHDSIVSELSSSAVDDLSPSGFGRLSLSGIGELSSSGVGNWSLFTVGELSSTAVSDWAKSWQAGSPDSKQDESSDDWEGEPSLMGGGKEVEESYDVPSEHIS